MKRKEQHNESIVSKKTKQPQDFVWPANVPSFDQISVEIVLAIACVSDIKSLLCLAMTCKTLLLILNGTEEIWIQHWGITKGQRKALSPLFELQDMKSASISKTLERCISCHQLSSVSCVMFHCVLCQSCRYLEGGRYQLMSATSAKKKFKIKDESLDALNYQVYKNQYRKDSYYYWIKDLHHVAIQVHGSEEGLSKAIEKSQQRSLKLKETKERKLVEFEKVKKERRKVLSQALKKYDLVIRDDSWVCQNWIENRLDDGDWPVERAIAIVYKMNVLHTKCNFARRWREERENLFEYIPHDEFKVFRQGVEDEVFDEYLRDHRSEIPHEILRWIDIVDGEW